MTTNPFDNEPESQGIRTGFGTLRLHVHGVVLVGGEGYTIPGLINPKTQEAWVFRGKKVADESRQKHIVMDVERTASDGKLYHAFCEFMYWDSDKGCAVALPALRKHFGKNLAGIFGKTAEVKYEEAHYTDKGKDGTEYDRIVFRVVEVYGTKTEREASEKAYFANVKTATPAAANGGVNLDEWKEFAGEMKADYNKALAVGKTQEAALNDLVRRYDPRGKEGLQNQHVAALIGLPL